MASASCHHVEHDPFRGRRREPREECFDDDVVEPVEGILVLGFSVWAHHMFVAGMADWLRVPMMISMDDPDHKKRRKNVSRGFLPRRVAEQEEHAQRAFGTHRSYEHLQECYLLGEVDHQVGRLKELAEHGMDYVVLGPITAAITQLDYIEEHINTSLNS